MARAQRLAYKKKHTNIDGLRNKILIETHFKQKILIDMSSRQANGEFYEQELRSCLGNFVNFMICIKKNRKRHLKDLEYTILILITINLRN